MVEGGTYAPAGLPLQHKLLWVWHYLTILQDDDQKGQATELLKDIQEASADLLAAIKSIRTKPVVEGKHILGKSVNLCPIIGEFPIPPLLTLLDPRIK